MTEFKKIINYSIYTLCILVFLNYIRIHFRNKRRLETNEGFTNLKEGYTNNSKSNRETVAFDTKYYLRNQDESVLKIKTLSVIPFRSNTYYIPNTQYDIINKEVNVITPITYLDKIVEYMRKKIYPLNPIISNSSIDTIHKLINDELDIGFINEEILLKYYNKNCRYLKQYLDTTFGTGTTPKYQHRILNFSVIASTFYQDMYLFVPSTSNISHFYQFADVNNQKIGVLEDSYYYLIKLINAYIIDNTLNNINQINIVKFNNLNSLLESFNKNTINALFMVSHPKNSELLNLTKNNQVKLVHLQKTVITTNNEEDDEIKYDAETRISNQEERLEQITSAAFKIKIVESETEKFNTIINNVFATVIPRSINLNSFYSTTNTYSYLNTYSLKTLLVMRNDINPKYGKMFIDNYFSNIDAIKNNINVNYFNVDVDNYNIIDFDYKDTISFYRHDLPIHKLAKQKYKECGFIKTVMNKKSKIDL